MENSPKRNFIAEVVSAHMKLHKISAPKLAIEMGLSQPTMNSLQRGSSKIRIRTLMTVARFFQWTAVEIGMAVWYSDKIASKPKRKKRGRRGDESESNRSSVP